MKKLTYLLITFFVVTCTFISVSYSGEINLLIHDFECIEDGKLVVHYGLVNTFDFEYQNVTVGFKIVEEGKTIACSETKVIVPKGADGSEINEIIIDVPCSGKSYSLKSAVFYYTKRYIIDEWFSDCN